MKRCIVCKVERPFECFVEGRKKCQLCRNTDKRAYRIGTIHKIKRLKYQYGLTLEALQKMTEEQLNLCTICSQPGNNRWTKGLVVDHCHKTGKVRSLLCDKCNKGLGQFMDNPDLLEKAAVYLRKHRE